MRAFSNETKKLELQGYSCNIDSQAMKLRHWLRLTPLLSTLWIAAGLFYSSPFILAFFALVSTAGAGMWNHPFDLVYNKGLRFLSGTPPLPPNPLPRRFSMGLAAGWSMLVAFFFAIGFNTTAYLLGGILITAGLTMTLTHFCLGAWIYKQFRGITAWSTE